jgi:PncC family amidohydrolase
MELPELGQTLAKALAGRKTTLGLAESCTGGLVADTITNVPGSSEFFAGSIVSYSNEVKEKVLGVPTALLVAHGAVSEEVARAMARGAREVLGADIGLGITGIAGPGGATDGKPVGLVHIAVAGPQGEACRRLELRGERLENKRGFAREAIALLLAYVQDNGAPR